MPGISLGRRIPPECVHCLEADSDLCPRLQDSRRPRRLARKLLRTARKRWPIIDGSLEAGRSLLPDVAVLVPTWDCNLHCPYCFQRNPNSPTGRQSSAGQMDLVDWQRVVDELKPLGIPVIVMGGEWSLYRNGPGLLRMIKIAGLALTLITNGTALTAFADDLVRLRIERLVVSIDGPAPIHNAIRGHANGYELAVAGIRRVIAGRGECSSPVVQVSCTVSPRTQAHLSEFADAMGWLGVDAIVFNNLIYATAEQVSAHQELLQRLFAVRSTTAPALSHQEHLGIDVATVKREMAAIRSGPSSARTIMLPPGSEQQLSAYYAPHAPFFRNQRCGVIHRELWVLPNGDVSACSQMTDLTTGNVLESSVLSVWNGRRYRKIRRQLAKGLLPACARCPKLAYQQPPAEYVPLLGSTGKIA